MAELPDRVSQLLDSLTTEAKTSGKPSTGLGALQRAMLQQLAGEYLAKHDDPTVGAGHHMLSDPMSLVTVGDAIALLEQMLRGLR